MGNKGWIFYDIRYKDKKTSPTIPEDYLDDIVKVFLLGVKTEHILESGEPIPDIIARPFPESDPRYFPYIVEWKTLFNIRKRMLRYLKESKNEKLINLAKAIEDMHNGK